MVDFRRKEIVLKVVAIVVVLIGFGSFAVGLFVRMIVNMDTSMFVRRFGPDGEEGWRTYDNLYGMSLNIVEVARFYTLAIYVVLGLGLVLSGVICMLWARDLKKLKS